MNADISEIHAETPRAEPGSWDVGFWQQVTSRGLDRLDTLADATAVVRAVSRTGRLVPLADATLIAGPVAAQIGVTLPPGILAVSPERSAGAVEVSRGPGGVVLEGRVRRVPWAAEADHLVVVARCGAGSALVVAPAPADLVDRRTPFAAHPVADVRFERTPVSADQVTPLPDGHESPLYRWGALARSVQMLGALEGALELSTAHVRTREQFGRPLAKFQAVQHLLAEFASEVALAKSAVEAAYASELPTEHAALAKICAGVAALTGSRAAHQVHGAIGFTDGYPLNSLTRTLSALRDEYGDEHSWGTELFDDVTRGGAGTVWERLVTGAF